MKIKNILDSTASFIVDPSKCTRKRYAKAIAWTVTIFLGISSFGTVQAVCFLWRKLRHIEKNDTIEKITVVFKRIFNKQTDPQNSSNNDPLVSLQEESLLQPLINPIDNNFTQNNSIIEQRDCHENAKKYLEEELIRIGADISFVSPEPLSDLPSLDDIVIQRDLDSEIFSWQVTFGVQGDIQNDAKSRDRLFLYGVASQFNACEATHRFTPEPGKAVETYEYDNTQGPGAQLQFPDQQVEIINNAANLGFSSLCYLLDEESKASVSHGYLTPQSKEMADTVIDQWKSDFEKVEFLCVGNVPKGVDTTEEYMRCW